MWSLEYTQVPIERKLKRATEVGSKDRPASTERENSCDSKDEGKLNILKQMNSLSLQDENGKVLLSSVFKREDLINLSIIYLFNIS